MRQVGGDGGFNSQSKEAQKDYEQEIIGGLVNNKHILEDLKDIKERLKKVETELKDGDQKSIKREKEIAPLYSNEQEIKIENQANSSDSQEMNKNNIDLE